MAVGAREEEEEEEEAADTVKDAKVPLNCQKLIEVDNECKVCIFCEKHRAIEVAADALGEEWKCYVVRISGGNDKDLTQGTVQLLLSLEHRYILKNSFFEYSSEKQEQVSE
ncbi:hypothetical protein A6R68_17298 [Neotoma lepida]|uniref:Small ribosomal subunit protein eS6 n=1 Tax=Neotoma lepida TaxID=56216 RepID=A0A1A6HF41_NEOLE|nr:hypothetical protein A6R68_17298 [Neotoma lepida]